jgi:hypothetical protein
MRIIKGRFRGLRRWSVVLALLALPMLLTAPVALADPFVTQDLSSTLTANDLAQALAGSGVTISNVVYTGAPLAAGTFTGGSGIIDFDSGVALSSGYVSSVLGPNNSSSMSGANGTPGDAALAALAGEDTYDAAILDFDFVPTSDKVTFQYVFGSEEYNEFVNANFNDVFAFYVNGVNYATVGSPAVPVSVDTINDGNPYGSTPNSHPELFVNNEYLWDTGDPMPAGARNTQLDGLTKTLIFEAPVVKNQTNHMRLAIADAGDEIYDSDVFIKAGSFAVENPPAVAVTTSPSAVNEGQTASAAGTWSDPDGDAVSLSASVGSVIENANGTWSWSYATSDGPAQSQTVTISANDGRGGTASTQFALSVKNVAPAVTAGSDKTIAVGDTFTGSGSFTDPGADAAWTATVDYGDGSGSAALALNANKTFSLAHAYTAVGAYTITVQVTDKDGAQGSATVHVVVQAANQARPHLIKLSPTRGRRGTTVTITGTNLGASQGASVVKFGGKACKKYLSWTATKIRCKVPAKAKFGKVSVVVTTSGGASNALRFKVRR